MRWAFLTLVLLLLVPAFVPVPETPEQRAAPPLSLKEALGQTLLIGFEGKELTPELETFMKKVQPGGVLLLARNIETKEQTAKLISDLKESSLLPLFVAVDQEGGAVSRVGWLEDTAQSELPDQFTAFEVSKGRAEGLAELGFNMNLAPVLDSADPKDYLFVRSFQQNPLVSSLFAFMLVQGHQESGVLSVPKHYPGYDGIPFNPETSVIPRAGEFPEAEAFSNLFFRTTPLAIMLSHVVYEEVDAVYPLPFSKQGIAEVKKRVGNDVVLMSDDLLSAAFLASYAPDEIGVKALLSGVDILLAAGYPDERLLAPFYDALWREAKENPELASGIRNSAQKIAELKLALFGEQ